MGIENPVHLLFIAIIALVVLGPRRLPELARALGHGIREFREAVSQQAETRAGPTVPEAHAVAVPDPHAPAPAASAFAEPAPAARPPVTLDPDAPARPPAG